MPKWNELKNYDAIVILNVAFFSCRLFLRAHKCTDNCTFCTDLHTKRTGSLRCFEVFLMPIIIKERLHAAIRWRRYHAVAAKYRRSVFTAAFSVSNSTKLTRDRVRWVAERSRPLPNAVWRSLPPENRSGQVTNNVCPRQRWLIY